MYKSYKYKVEYHFKGAVGAPQEVKMDTFEELEGFLGSIVMIMESATVYRKIKGQWQAIRFIKGEFYYPEVQL